MLFQKARDGFPESVRVVQVGRVGRLRDLHHLACRDGPGHLLCGLASENAAFGAADDKGWAADVGKIPQKVVVVKPGKDLPVIGPVPPAIPSDEGFFGQVPQVFRPGVGGIFPDLCDEILRGGVRIREVFVEPEEVFPVPVRRAGLDVDVDEGGHPVGVERGIEAGVQGPHGVPQQDHAFQAQMIDQGGQIKHIIPAPVGRRHGPAALAVSALIQGDDPEARCQMRSDQIPRAGVVPGAVKEDHGPSSFWTPFQEAELQALYRKVLFLGGLFGRHRLYPFQQAFHNGDIGRGKIITVADPPGDTQRISS